MNKENCALKLVDEIIRQKFLSQNNKYQLLARRHVSAKCSYHQANIEARYRYIKCALNWIPLRLQYMDQYCKHNGIIELKLEEETSKMLHLEHGFVWC